MLFVKQVFFRIVGIFHFLARRAMKMLRCRPGVHSPKIEAHLGRARRTCHALQSGTAMYGNWFDKLLTSITHVCQHLFLFLCIPKHSSGTAIITFI